MMRITKSVSRCCTSATLAVAMLAMFFSTLFFQNALVAQISETQLTRFATDDTVLAAHVNIESMLNMMDKSTADYKYVNKSMSKAAGYAFGAVRTSVIMLDHNVDFEESDYPDPTQLMLIGIEWQAEVESSELMQKWLPNIGDDYVEDQLEGFDYFRVEESDFYTPNFLFPNERSLILGRDDVVRKAIQGVRDSGSTGGKLIGKLDVQHDVHVVLDLAALDDEERYEFLDRIFDGMEDEVREEYLDHVERAEIKVALRSKQPLFATVEMSDDEHAEKLKSIIHTGIMLAPGAIDMARDSLEVSEFMPQEMVDSIERALEKAEEILDHVSVDRDAAVVTIKIEKMGGFPEATDLLISLYAGQMRMIEQMMEGFGGPDGMMMEAEPAIEMAFEDHDHEDDDDGDDGDDDDGDEDDKDDDDDGQ